MQNVQPRPSVEPGTRPGPYSSNRRLLERPQNCISGRHSGIWKGPTGFHWDLESAPRSPGFTSPARSTRTVSPTRISFLATSSALWRVARLMVTPPTSTGFKSARGVSVPVRPTDMAISCTSVISFRGGNLKAIAQRVFWISSPTEPASLHG